MAPVPNPDQTLVLSPFSTPESTAPPALMVNLVLRIVLAVVSNVICWVPLRILHRNQEFASSVFIVNVMGLNLLVIINALIWHDDDMDNWWAGYGWCDLHPYLYVPMITLYTTSVLAHARNMADKVGMLRAHPLTSKERRKKILVQALIMFPLPVIQMIWMYPITAQRYTIATLTGCEWRVHGSWPYFVFFLLPAPIMCLLAGWYVGACLVLTFIRFRELRKSTQGALMTSRSAVSHQNRTRRRLYFFIITILTPYVPLQCALATFNVMQNFPLEPFNFHKIHYEASPFPWNSILFVPSNEIGPVFLNAKYISIISGFVVFLYFGATPDAYNDYRRFLVALGFGRIFPKLLHDYNGALTTDPRSDSGSWGSQTIVSNTDTTLKSVAREASYPLGTLHLSSNGNLNTLSGEQSLSGHGGAARNVHPSAQLPDFILSFDQESSTAATTPSKGSGRGVTAQPKTSSYAVPTPRSSTPLREYLSNTAIQPQDEAQPSIPTVPIRNDTLPFRTTINFPQIQLPSLTFWRRKERLTRSRAARPNASEATLIPLPSSHSMQATSASPPNLSSPESKSLGHVASSTWRQPEPAHMSTHVWSTEINETNPDRAQTPPRSRMHIQSDPSSEAQRHGGGVTIETQITQHAN